MDFTEGEIATKKLDISISAFKRYKNSYPELAEKIEEGRILLAEKVKATLRKKSEGFYYKETKRTYTVDEEGNQIGEMKVEEVEKYAPPDTGASHLLLKNIDPNWKNDDQATLSLKREKLELEKQKAEAASW